MIYDSSKEIVAASDKMHSCIEELYKELLIHEADFSLSYGFGRVIDACRVIYNKCPRMIGMFSVANNEFIECWNNISSMDIIDPATEQSIKQELGEKTNNIYQIMLEIHKMSVEFQPYIKELQLKYSNVNR